MLNYVFSTRQCAPSVRIHAQSQSPDFVLMQRLAMANGGNGKRNRHVLDVRNHTPDEEGNN